MVEVTKRPGAPFAERISVGRTRASDVCLALPKISKFHAYFTISASDSTISLTDGGSKNGTFVGRKRLGAKEATTVTDGDEIQFGSYAFTFLAPPSFQDLLARLTIRK